MRRLKTYFNNIKGVIMSISNSYENINLAAAYAKLEFPNTYYLAYRDLPEIISAHVQGTKAVDFGCGAGRSSRFLQKIGFDTIGVDISDDMIKKASEIDSKGQYYHIEDGDLSLFKDSSCDLLLSAFTFDNISTIAKKQTILKEICRILTKKGRFINLVSTPEIYKNEWASFSTKDFPENRLAVSGDRVKIIITDIEDKTPVEDIVCHDEDYMQAYTEADMELVKTYKPLAKESDSYKWVNETTIPPWAIHVLKKKATIN